MRNPISKRKTLLSEDDVEATRRFCEVGRGSDVFITVFLTHTKKTSLLHCLIYCTIYVPEWIEGIHLCTIN